MLQPLCSLAAGELRVAPLASILIEALRKKATGEIVFAVQGGTSRLYLREGRPCGVQVFFGFKPLGQFLLELGWIDLHGLERSLMAVADGRKQGEALVSLGLLSASQLEEGLGLLHRNHLRTLAALKDGTYAFDPSVRLPAWTEEIHLGAHRAIVDALQTKAGQVVAERIVREGAPTNPKLRLRQGWERFAGHFELEEDEATFVETFAEPRWLQESLLAATIPAPDALALIAAFSLMGVIVPHREERQVAVPVEAPEVRVDARPEIDRSAGPELGRSAGPELSRSAGPELGRSAGPELGRSAGPELGRSAGPEPSRSAGPEPSRSVGPAAEEDERNLEALIERRYATIGSGDLFERLGVDREASPQQIKQGFLRTVKVLHPDRLPPSLSHLAPKVQELFSAVTEANDILSDERRRKQWLKEQEASAAVGEGIRNPDVRQLAKKGEELLAQRRYSQALAFFMQALQMEEHPDLRAHVIWAANTDPTRPAFARARQELERLGARYPQCGQVSHYLNALDLLEREGIS